MDYLQRLIENEFRKIDIKFRIQEALIMATFTEIMTGIERNGKLVVECSDSLATQTTEIRALIERLRSGVAPTDDELARAIGMLDNQGEKLAQLRDTVLQIIPTVDSPTDPSTPPTSDSPAPEFPTTTEPPASPDDVTVEPSPDNVGLPGSVDISS